ncbi:MAG: hypothetical protein HZA48_09290 [Planctomycetes bacterium]|nr:hypothetical protein [Planctomycetota bacterium]
MKKIRKCIYCEQAKVVTDDHVTQRGFSLGITPTSGILLKRSTKNINKQRKGFSGTGLQCKIF